MNVSRLLAAPAALLLTAVHPVGQEQPISRTGPAAQPAVGAPRAGGNREHGRYIVERVAICFECHSTRDASGNLIPGTLFKGGPMPQDAADVVPYVGSL